MQFIPLALYAFLCVVLGIAGRKTRIGGIGVFLLSIICTPLIVGLVLAIIVPRREPAVARRSARRQTVN